MFGKPFVRTIQMGFSAYYHLSFYLGAAVGVILLLNTEVLADDENEESVIEDEVCYDLIGCFPQDYPWVSLTRPFPSPWSPTEINVTLYLITRRNPEMDYAINPYKEDLESEMRSVDFYAKRQATVFIVHGFFSSGYTPWLKNMADAYLSKRNANVFIVDWENGANNANYLQVASNTRVVSAVVARFIKYLIRRRNLETRRIHLIGHSLGAHICGYIGKQITGIERITALDAAQICFEGESKEVRIDADDAVFIDVLHTNAKPTVPLFGLGFIRAIGDVDFYLNGGLMQPNCYAQNINISSFTSPLQIARLPVIVIGTYLSCSHTKSTEYFIESIASSDCTFWGHKNSVLESVVNTATMGRVSRMLYNTERRCNLQTCIPMGLETFAYPARGSFSVETNINSPYCNSDGNDETKYNMESALYKFYTEEN